MTVSTPAMSIIGIGQQMAFYLKATEQDLQFEHVTEDCGSVCCRGEWFDFYFDPTTLIVTQYLPAV